MSLGLQFYVSTLAVYLGVSIIASLALNFEFADAGIPNFAFIIFQAIGGYVQAILTLGPQTANGGFQQYIGGYQLPFPVPLVAAAAAGALLAIPIGAVTMLRLRRDFQALVLLVFSIMATNIVTDVTPLFNGPAGLSLVPQPLRNDLGLATLDYQWFYAGLTAVICLATFWFLHRMTESPLGRTIRATRDHQGAAEALGKNSFWLRVLVLMAGGALAAVSGAVLVGFIGVWSPQAWEYQETLVYFGAVIIGGVGNRLGVALGAFLLPVGFAEATRFLPNFGPAGLSEALQWVSIALLILLFLWFWPRGIIPERRRLPRRDTKRRAIAEARVREPAEVGVDSSSNGGASRAVRAVKHSREAILDVRDLRCSFGGVHAVDGASFTVAEGSTTGLIGPNGAGKSTALSAIAGSVTPASGSINFAGRDISAVPTFQRARRGLIRTYQLPSEFSRLTVLENLLVATTDRRPESFMAAMLGPRYWKHFEDSLIDRAQKWLIRFGMADKETEYAGSLSSGQKRLVEIMRALMMEPKLLLLDEPFAGVNPRLASEIAGYIEGLRADGLTVLMIGHELRMIERLCDPIIVMADGRVLFEGHMQAIRQSAEVRRAYLDG